MTNQTAVATATETELARIAKEKLALDFTSRSGRYFKKLKRGRRPDTEVVLMRKNRIVELTPNGPIKAGKDELDLTGRRMVQFLNASEEITADYKNENGSLNIEKLATDCGYTVEGVDDLFATGPAKEKKYNRQFKYMKKRDKDKKIEGFSVQGEIYYRKNLSEPQKRFVVAHELAHHLLGHYGMIFGRVAGSRNNAFGETWECSEEADKLAAMFLMPHKDMKDHLDTPDAELAARFGVSEHAVRKRKEEVKTELYGLCYGRQ